MVRTLRAGLHGFPGAWRRCNYKRREWNNYSSSLRLALHPENRTLQPVQRRFLGLFMPFSQSSQISSIVKFIEDSTPTSLLDVGTGMGQYGFLARNSLEQANLFHVDGAQAAQKSKPEWQVRIDGIEGCAIYLTPVHEYAYNHIMVGEAIEMLGKLSDNAYDLVLAIDILEHFTKPDGLKFLDELKRVAKRAVLVSTPKEFHSQEIEANPYENHRSHWTDEDLKQEGYGEILANAESWIAIHRKASHGVE